MIMKILILVLILISSTAYAEKSPFKFSWKLDLSLIMASSIMASMPVIISKELRRPHCNYCNPSDVTVLDRGVVNYRSPGARLSSDILLYVMPVIPLGVSLMDGWKF